MVTVTLTDAELEAVTSLLASINGWKPRGKYEKDLTLSLALKALKSDKRTWSPCKKVLSKLLKHLDG